MKTFTDKILTLILSLFLITYGFYQGTRFVKNPYQTEIAYDYTVSDSYTGKGIFIRDETSLNESYSGVINYLYADGTKVTKDMLIAQVYSNEQDAIKQNTIISLEKEIENLKKIETNTSVNYSGTEMISKQIATTIINIVNDGYIGIVDNISKEKYELLSLINKKQIVSGKVDNYEEKITELENNLQSLKDNTSGVAIDIFSPINGYFASTSDGMESKFSSENIKNLSIQNCKSVIENPLVVNKNTVGKIITSHNWYFATVVSAKDIEKFAIGRNATLDFATLNILDVNAKVNDVIINDENSEEAIVVFKSNYIIDDLTTERVTEVNARFKSYSGLKISSEAIRFKDNLKGVYVIDDQQVKFKQIDVVYEGNSYILSNPESRLNNAVTTFDEIIVGGVDLYDGKSIK